jgi:mRNA-degrading endonuclease toxin of MazEF toxin-antitoxin module
MLRGKIVTVPFPFDDSVGGKPRPALCLTEAIGPFKQIVVAYISSQIPDPDDSEPFDILIDDRAVWFRSTGLRTASVLKTHKLTTIAARHVRRELGHLPDTIMEAVSRKLRELFVLGS